MLSGEEIFFCDIKSCISAFIIEFNLFELRPRFGSVSENESRDL